MSSRRLLPVISLAVCLTLLASIVPAPATVQAQDGGEVYLPLVTTGGSSGPSAFDLIDDAEAAGTIDHETALLYQVYAIFGDPRLPEAYRGSDDADLPDVDTLFVIDEEWETLSEATQTLLVPFLTPPIYSGSWFDLQQNGLTAPTTPSIEPICDGLANGWNFVLGNTAPVKVWWHNSHPEDQAKATAVAGAMDNAIWIELIGLMGQDHAPLKDGGLRCNGGDDRLDIYLDNLDKINGVAGFFRDYNLGPGTGCRPRPVHIHVKRTRAGNDLLSTTTHEFMHAIQLTYRPKEACKEYTWLWEATATWAVDYVYRDFNTEHGYAPRFLNKPELSLETEDVTLDDGRKENRAYGAYVFFFYLSRIVSQPALIKTIWDNTAQYNSLEAINRGIPGGLAEHWPKFVKYALNRPPVEEFRELDRLQHKVKMATDDPIPVDLGGGLDLEIDIPATGIPHLAARYHHFTFPDPTVRSVGFFNGLRGNLNKKPWDISPLMSPGTTYHVDNIPVEAWEDVHIWAIVKYEGGDWQEPEDWTARPYKGFCRDVTAERITDLVLIFSNSEYVDRNYTLQPQGLEPTLYVSNMGCWQWEGKTTWTRSGLDGITHRYEIDVLWQRVIIHPDSYLPTVLRPVSATGSYKVSGTAANGCTHFANQPINIPPEDHHTMYIYDRILSGPAYRAYGGQALYSTIVTVSVTCPDGSGGTYEVHPTFWYDPPTGINDALYWKTIKEDGITINDTETEDFFGTITTETREFTAKQQ